MGFGLKDATRASNILDMDSLLHANILKKFKNILKKCYAFSGWQEKKSALYLTVVCQI